MPTFEVAIEAISTAYLTIEADTEDEAVAEAVSSWDAGSMQEPFFHRALVERTPGVLTEVDVEVSE